MHSAGVGCASRADLTGFSCPAAYPLEKVEKVVALLPSSGAAGSLYYSPGALQAFQMKQLYLNSSLCSIRKQWQFH